MLSLNILINISLFLVPLKLNNNYKLQIFNGRY